MSNKKLLSTYRFANITIAVYGALSEIVDHGFGFTFKEMGLIVDAAYCSTLLFIFVDCSHKSTLEVIYDHSFRIITVHSFHQNK